MSRLKLGMDKGKVTHILGSSYTIAEKKVKNGDQIEVLSYRNFPYADEFYMFLFKNNKLMKWYRSFKPKYETSPE